jgi:hypothetical protein
MSYRPVGLSMLPAHVGTSRQVLAALQRDFARLRTLEHPHIARLLELGCNGQQYYVTTEKLDGEPLREVLSHLAPERLDTGEADDVLRAIGSALAYAHEHGVAHGDVRAENVLVTMDRRFVLINFLASRIAKVSARPPRPSDDLKGLARLAAELYTGSTSPHALRRAAHSGVPAARLNAIRAVVETRRVSTVAEFLAAAGLAVGARLASPPRPAESARRSRSMWRLVLPMAAVAAAAGMIVAYYGGVGASAQALKERGLDALRAVAVRARSSAEQPPVPPATGGEPLPDRDAAGDLTPVVLDPATESAPSETENAPVPPLDASPEPAEAASTPSRTTATPDAHAQDPAVLSLGVPKIAAREDHTVVAIEIVRSGDTTDEAAVGWWTSPDTAHADDDYANLGRQTVTFPAGATVERVLIPIINDGLRESDEAFTVHLSRPRGGVAGAVTATRVTLHDDD